MASYISILSLTWPVEEDLKQRIEMPSTSYYLFILAEVYREKSWKKQAELSDTDGDDFFFFLD